MYYYKNAKAYTGFTLTLDSKGADNKDGPDSKPLVGLYVLNGTWPKGTACPAADVYNHVGACDYLGVDVRGKHGVNDKFANDPPYMYGIDSHYTPAAEYYFTAIGAKDSTYDLKFVGAATATQAVIFVVAIVALATTGINML
eukprot:TRINITY_DN1790_c1_g2_i1.p2 TRINITY_DN1790_c1_g2~~TRINITY_DN1790_c1_g2_i1.p2  ORF type:complete len:142 (+),score=46.68 TRINITY_DN1790_c1_g2_i1:672-1097(+)